jgi:hypothetical protein
MNDWYSRPNAALVDGKVRFRASAIGGCAKGLAWDLRASQGMDKDLPTEQGFPESVQIAMDESSALESHAVDLLRDGGWNIFSLQESQSREIAENIVLEGTPDCADEKGNFLLEVKTVGSSLWKQLSNMPDTYEECSALVQKYLWQVAAYEAIFDQPCHLGVVEKNNGALTGNFVVLHWHELPVPKMKDLVAKMVEVVELAESDDLSCVGGSGDLCKWEQRHSRPHVDVGQELTLLRIQEATVKSMSEDIRNLREHISNIVREVGGKAECNGVKLTWVSTHVVEKKPREYDRNYLKITWDNEITFPGYGNEEEK